MAEAESLLVNTTALVVQQLQLPPKSCAVITNGRVLWVVDPRDSDNTPPGVTGASMHAHMLVCCTCAGDAAGRACTHASMLHLRLWFRQTWVVPPVHSDRTVSICGSCRLLAEKCSSPIAFLKSDKVPPLALFVCCCASETPDPYRGSHSTH